MNHGMRLCDPGKAGAFLRATPFPGKGVNAPFLIAAVAVFFGSTAGAQTPNSVTLKFDDDGESVSGELLEFSNNLFRIKSTIGTVAIPADGISCIGAACPEGTKAEVTGSFVTVTSLDGSIKISGNLIDVKEDDYLLATNVGEIRIPIDSVTCEGDGCITPAVVEPADRFVQLTDGDVEISGQLIETGSNFLLIETEALGVIHVARDSFECSGEACP